MDKELKERWVAALRSGKYKQTTGILKAKNGAMCCLGVLCDIQKIDWDSEFPTENELREVYLPPHLNGGMKETTMSDLASRNDGDDYDKHTFLQIADHIEKQL